MQAAEISSKGKQKTVLTKQTNKVPSMIISSIHPMLCGTVSFGAKTFDDHIHTIPH